MGVVDVEAAIPNENIGWLQAGALRSRTGIFNVQVPYEVAERGHFDAQPGGASTVLSFNEYLVFGFALDVQLTVDGPNVTGLGHFKVETGLKGEFVFDDDALGQIGHVKGLPFYRRIGGGSKGAIGVDGINVVAAVVRFGI